MDDEIGLPVAGSAQSLKLSKFNRKKLLAKHHLLPRHLRTSQTSTMTLNTVSSGTNIPDCNISTDSIANFNAVELNDILKKFKVFREQLLQVRFCVNVNSSFLCAGLPRAFRT